MNTEMNEPAAPETSTFAEASAVALRSMADNPADEAADRQRQTETGRKIPPTAKLKLLPLDRQYEIYNYAEEHGLRKCAQWLAEGEDGVKAHFTTVGDFQHWFAGTQLVQDRLTDKIDRLREGNPGLSFEEARRMAIEDFQMVNIGRRDQKAFISLGHLDLKERTAAAQERHRSERLELAKQRMELVKQKMAAKTAPEKAAEPKRSPLTAEEQMAKYRQIFGIREPEKKHFTGVNGRNGENAQQAPAGVQGLTSAFAEAPADREWKGQNGIGATKETY
jgi:hypothetical protein